MVHAPFMNESTSWNGSFCVAISRISIFWPVMSRNVILGKMAGAYDAYEIKFLTSARGAGGYLASR